MRLIRTAAASQLLPRTTFRNLATTRRSASTGSHRSLLHHRTHLLFGANTEVGKSVVSAGLVRAAVAASASASSSSSSRRSASVNYIKPLQCGGSDESFVLRHRDEETKRTDDGSNDDGGSDTAFDVVNCQTLFSWDTPASPHLASRWENSPVSDDEVLAPLRSSLKSIVEGDDDDDDGGGDESNESDDDVARSVTVVESAGGALSPPYSSPLNGSTMTEGSRWGWSTQADLYSPLGIPVVFVGDGKLGGISVTLASLESLWSRGYRIDAIVFIEGAAADEDGDGGDIRFGESNAEALREYVAMRLRD